MGSRVSPASVLLLALAACLDSSTISTPAGGDGGAPTSRVDEDGDGVSPADGDCDDGDPTVGPGATERCNGVDDDCNGTLDDVPGAGEGCDSGMPGRCAGGELRCLDARISCTPRFGPIAETCNGVDDDCNGVVDDGDVGGGASCTSDSPGPCAPGVLRCDGGALVCVSTTTMPGPEVCANGIDDDCDATTDETPCIMGL